MTLAAVHHGKRVAVPPLEGVCCLTQAKVLLLVSPTLFHNQDPSSYHNHNSCSRPNLPG
jgi:hypothetical protein